MEILGQRPLKNRNPKHYDSGDWSFSLGGGNGQGLAVGEYPAKFGFYTGGGQAVPDCVNDFVVMGLNVNGGGGQANLVAFNNLYTNPSGSGFCTGTTPSVRWAYNLGAHPINTSVVLALDGSKLAYVLDNACPGGDPQFEVLTPANGGSVSSPQSAPSSPSLVTLCLTGGGHPGASSPYVDYVSDTAYVASHNGRLFKIHPVFSGTPALDTSWTSNPIAISGNPQMSSPVYDQVSGNIFVGAINGSGDLYGFRASNGTALSGSPVNVGNGNANGGIEEGPIVDAFNGFVYAFAGDNGTNAVAVQIKTDFTSSTSQIIGTRNKHPIHLGAFDDNYYSSLDSTTWSLYVCGIAGGGGNTPHLYRIGFNSSRVMNAVTDIGALSALNEECSPATEFLNGTTDWLFLGLQGSNLINSYVITSPPTNATANTSKTAQGGTSGIIVDNDSSQPEASSIYYSTQKTDNCGKICAVKRTQSGLN